MFLLRNLRRSHPQSLKVSLLGLFVLLLAALNLFASELFSAIPRRQILLIDEIVAVEPNEEEGQRNSTQQQLSTLSGHVHENTTNTVNDENWPPFVREYCDLTGVDDWMVPEHDWRRRSPAFLIIGEKKSGTTGLFQTLMAHPQVIRGARKELIFFNPKKFKFWENNEIGGRVKVAQAREALFSFFKRRVLQHHSSLITGEGTPEYLVRFSCIRTCETCSNVIFGLSQMFFSAQLYPDICDKAILCTIPWVKVIVIIREPVERLFSHYNFLKDPTKHNMTLPSFEKFVLHDLTILQKTGVLPQNLSEIEAYMGTKAQMDAYKKYQHLVKVGERQFLRSLYILQLEGWERALRRFGKDPSKDMRVVISSEVRVNSNVTNDLLEWLGLPRVNHAPKRAMVTKYTSVPIKPGFKAYLNAIIAPFNSRLYKFLGDKYEGIFHTPRI